MMVLHEPATLPIEAGSKGVQEGALRDPFFYCRTNVHRLIADRANDSQVESISLGVRHRSSLEHVLPPFLRSVKKELQLCLK
jgi:hypothetical protein